MSYETEYSGNFMRCIMSHIPLHYDKYDDNTRHVPNNYNKPHFTKEITKVPFPYEETDLFCFKCANENNEVK